MTPEQFRAWYESQGLTQAEAAERLGLPNPREGGKVSVSRWSTGARSVPRAIEMLVRTLQKLEPPQHPTNTG